jgi:hypothetical protein
MNPWTFYKDALSPDAEAEFVEIAWEEISSGFEMRVSRGTSRNKAIHKTMRYAFSTEEQLSRAVKKCRIAALCDGFKPSLDYPRFEN